MSSTPSEFLATRAFPELSVAVRSAAETTMLHWESVVTQRLPKAHQLTVEQLRDDLPDILQQIANALESPAKCATEELSKSSPMHGTVRFDQGYNLDEMLIEYGILREMLIAETAAHLNRDLDLPEALAMGAAVDVTQRRSVGRFVNHLTLELKAASEAQSKYLSFLSHDLRGGLNGVFLMIEVLKRELSAEPKLADTVEDLDMMRRSLLETVATMDRFLHAERFRKGKVQVHPMPMKARSVLQEIAAHFTYQARDKGLLVSIEASDECTIVSDKELLMLIFQNLISNALKYSQRGTRVVITASDHGDGCTISVKDQGPGIAPERLSNLFDPFSRGETHGQPGMGLGLTIARQAAGFLNAKLWAESEVGKGSTFILALPKTLAGVSPT